MKSPEDQFERHQNKESQVEYIILYPGYIRDWHAIALDSLA